MVQLFLGHDLGDCILGVDEKPLHFKKGGGKRVRTLELQGAPAVRRKENHSASRDRVSVITCITSDSAAVNQPGYDILGRTRRHATCFDLCVCLLFGMSRAMLSEPRLSPFMYGSLAARLGLRRGWFERFLFCGPSRSWVPVAGFTFACTGVDETLGPSAYVAGLCAALAVSEHSPEVDFLIKGKTNKRLRALVAPPGTNPIR